MRRSVARAVVTLLPAALLVPFGGTASAGTCVALGTPPHFVPRQGTNLTASGSFRCDVPAEGMTVTVCIEELGYGTGGEEVWWQTGCATGIQIEEADEVSATVEIGVPVYATWLRTTVVGTNAAGDKAWFETPLMFWFNCACYIG